jgi:hypothetical protein
MILNHRQSADPSVKRLLDAIYDGSIEAVLDFLDSIPDGHIAPAASVKGGNVGNLAAVPDQPILTMVNEAELARSAEAILRMSRQHWPPRL